MAEYLELTNKSMGALTEIPTVISKKSKPTKSVVYNTYWKFAKERQDVFYKKMRHPHGPWSNDPIISEYKFTNTYRVTDRVSQYLVKNVIYSGDYTPRDLLFRILLFKTFNKIETWKTLEKRIGEISYSNYSFEEYSKVLNSEIGKRVSIYSGAYIMTSGKSSFGYERKFKNHLRLLESIIKGGLAEELTAKRSLQDVYLTLLKFPTIGSFLAYQYAIDINYSPLIDFSEMDFVMPGPGALDGIRKCFTDYGDYNESDIIKYVADQQEYEFDRLELDFKKIGNRRLQLIDCQNIFCEVDKYSRVKHPNITGLSGRSRIKQKYTNLEKPKIDYHFPPKWGIELDALYLK